MKTVTEHATVQKALLFTALFAVCYVLINFTAIGVAGLLRITGGANILDFEFGYTGEEAYQMLTALGGQGRAFYLACILPLDFVFPVAYMLCYGAWISFFARQIAPGSQLCSLVWVPVLAMLFDWTENIGIIALLHTYPSLPSWAVVTASTAGMLKMGCIIASIAIIGILLTVSLVRRGPGR